MVHALTLTTRRAWRIFSHTSADQNESPFSSDPNSLLYFFFLVIQRASEPLCFISLPCYSARIRSADDL